MYEDFFGFERAPFNNVPDTAFFFGSARHNESLAQLLFAVESRKGFAVLSGEVGAGKTTVTRALLRRLDPSTVTAVITNSRLTGLQLLYTVANEFGLEPESQSRPRLIESINDHLIKMLAQDRNVILLVDEAQDLPLGTLEEIRLISNLETETDKLIQIVLVGQPELRNSIDHPDLRQLRQRIALRYHLDGLERKEVRDYVRHRLMVAGPAHTARFTDRALNTIFRYSRGIPRLVNLVADKALLVAFTEENRKIDQATILAGIREVEGPGFSFRTWEREHAGASDAPASKKPFIRMPFLGWRG